MLPDESSKVRNVSEKSLIIRTKCYGLIVADTELAE
jgi:hypothetical protein